ncbi:syntaxin-18 [Plakobranchus ocellatus]|uniref:Syntaxin-18 n=1 Tax=Plakobranchus ocellatus TaxID=259542 RepID=A0AAV4BDZ4_9GAST|nr:syntaxin-18 [Plakobranchus ocellatus]
MADVTNVFKATVKALKSRNKALSEMSNEDPPSQTTSKREKSDFESRAKELVKTISRLRDFLLQHRKEYVSSGSLLSIGGSGLSESERDQIDNDAQEIMKTCKQTIVMFRVEADRQKALPQVKEHRNAVMILIESYLKAICKIYSEQKAVRVKRVVDKKKISKLEPERKHSQYTRKQLKKEFAKDHNSTMSDKENISPETDRLQSTRAVIEETPVVENEDDQITLEEAQMFELENKTLYEEMNSMVQEVRQIEGQVVEIAKLQEIFTEKILEQDVQINTISNTVVGTTENIKDANEEIREAIKKKAEFRVWILFFLLVCSLSLLFLDWYNN